MQLEGIEWKPYWFEASSVLLKKIQFVPLWAWPDQQSPKKKRRYDPKREKRFAVPVVVSLSTYSWLISVTPCM